MPLVLLALVPPFGWMVLIFAGLPYLGFSLTLFILTRTSSERKISRLSFIASVLFFPLIWVYWALVFGLPDSAQESLKGALVLLAYVMVAGYGFVGLIHLGAVLMYRKKSLTKSSKATPKSGAL